MQNDVMKSFEQFNRTALDSMKRLGEINSRALKRLGERQMAAASDYMEGGVKQVQLLSEVKELKDVVAGQSRLAGEFNEKLVDHVRKTSDILLETRGEFAAWVEDGLKATGENPFTKVAGKSAKTAA